MTGSGTSRNRSKDGSAPIDVDGNIFTGFRESHSINKKVTELMEELVSVAGEPSKKSEFRSSNFPYCPIIDLEARVTGETGFVESYESGFYTSIGTAVHENLQFWIPFIDKWKKHLWGDWACRACGDRVDGKLVPQVYASLQPEPCSCGKKGAGWQYLEVGFERGELTHEAKALIKKGKLEEKDLTDRHRIPLGGHVDLIFKFGSEFWIIDAKTSGLEKLMKPGWRAYYPSLSNVAQIKNYCIMFKLKFSLPLGGWMLLYVSRDSLLSFRQRKPVVRAVSHEWEDKDFKKWGNRLYRAAKGRKYVENLLETGEVKWAKAVVASRPCRKPSEYKSWMKARWYDKKDCPHFKSGKCCLPEKFGNGMVSRVEFLASTIEANRKADIKEAGQEPKPKQNVKKRRRRKPRQ